MSCLSHITDDKHGSSGDNSNNSNDDIEDDSIEDAKEANDETKDKVPEMMMLTRTRTRTRTISRSVYTDCHGNPVSQDVIADINQFQVSFTTLLSHSPYLIFHGIIVVFSVHIA